MKVLLVVAALFAAASAFDDLLLRQQFKNFQKNFDKKYSSYAETEERFAIFKNNFQNIQSHNQQKTSWKKDVNQFTDLTESEFKSRFGRLNIANKGDASSPQRSKQLLPSSRRRPDSVDWRTEGVVTPPKDQGSCGSCWAFAAAEQLESYAAINGGSLLQLSPQQINSCTPNPLSCGGTGGCMGSIPQLAWTYTQLFGLLLETDMPYTSGDFGLTGSCDYDADAMQPAVWNRGYEKLPINDMEAVLEHLYKEGPLSVAVAANSWSFYSHGVFDGCSYTSNIEINHAVQLVGYGTDSAEGDYWLVRNSWGPNWGEDGYIRLKRESTLECGTDSTPGYGTACEGDGQDTQHVCGMCGVLFDVAYPIGAEEAK